MQDYKKLKVWEKSRELIKMIYGITANFPKEEQYGLINQIRRASVSIAANISEGCSRHSENDFVRFLEIALGSANEVECLLILACDLGFTPKEELQHPLNHIIEIKKMLSTLIKKIKTVNCKQ